MSPLVTWVCDGCMRDVTAFEVAEWADFEHVVCKDCDRKRRESQ